MSQIDFKKNRPEAQTEISGRLVASLFDFARINSYHKIIRRLRGRRWLEG